MANMKAGKEFSLQIKEGGKWKEIGRVTEFPMLNDEHFPETEEWATEVSGVIDCEIIDFDETWLVAYAGRMYSEYFKN